MSTDSETNLRIILTAPFPAIRAGLRSLLTQDSNLQVLAECAGPEEWPPFLDTADAIVIAPFNVINQSWWQKTESTAPRTPILLLLSQPLTFFPEREGTPWGAVPFSIHAQQLSQAVRALAAGFWVARLELIPALDSRLPTSPGGEVAGVNEPLTEREHEILQYLSQGLTNKQIAHRVKISAHTVKFHVTSIYSKLGVNNRTEAARQGLRQGLINL